MNIAEFYKYKKENTYLSDSEFAVKVWNLQHQQMRENIKQRELESFEKAAEKKIEQGIDKNIEKAIETALLSGKSNFDIQINI